MSLIKYLIENTYVKILLTEGRKDVIIDKIGLPEDAYNWIVRNVDKKFQMWFANALRSWVDKSIELTMFRDWKEQDYLDDLMVDGEPSSKDRSWFDKLQWIIENIFKTDQKPDINIRDYDDYSSVKKLKDQWATIKDFQQGATPTPNLKEMDWDEAFEKAEDWHNNLKASGLSAEIKDVAPDAEIIHTFDDGWKWVDMKTNKCGELGDLMGHCATTDADTMLQLISPKGEFKVTVAFDYDGEYKQAKGTQNNKPRSEYDKYMSWLFTNGGKYQLKSYKSEYKQGNDYHVTDLPDDVRDNVMEEYPDLNNANPILKAEALFDEGKKDEAMETLNKAIGESYGFGNYGRVIGFYNDDFWVWVLDVHPAEFDNLFNDNIFNFKHAKVEHHSLTSKLMDFVEQGGQDTRELIKDLNEEVDVIDSDEFDRDITISLPHILNKYPKEITNDIITNIVKENPNLYKGDLNKNREHLIEDIIVRKIESDKTFEIKYRDIIQKAGLGFDIASLELEKYSVRTTELKEMIESVFKRTGFVWFNDGEEAGYWYIQNMDSYWDIVDDEPSLLFGTLSYDDVYSRISEFLKYDFDNVGKNETYAEIIDYAKKLKKTNPDLIAEELLIWWLLGVEPTRDIDATIMKQFVSDGYLDSTLIGGGGDEAQTKLNI